MYARVVTSQVIPGKLNELARLFQETVRPVLEHQPGFKEIFVLTNPQSHKEVSITLWHTKADMEAFDVHIASLSPEFAPLLARVPDVEIFEVSLPAATRLTHDVPFSERSLGIRIEEPFDIEPMGLPA